jgi:predicted nuclease of restriction endonuclease-like (RecB) superfamily
MNKQFSQVVRLIRSARKNAIKAVNTEMINLYWSIGEYISNKIQKAEWGDGVVIELAEYIQYREPEAKGFSDKNLWRMKQFYEAYKDFPKLSTLLREISWSHNLTIFSRCKSVEEREFYLKLTIKESFSFRELDRQISASLYERTMIGNSKLSTVLRESQNGLKNTFKDTYVFEFLNLPDTHNESDLQRGLLKQMKNFILELGKDFIFIDEEYKLQVGNADFYIDLVFYHRALNCLIAIELKSDKFKPAYIGQMNFYLEALDRDVRKPNENPSMGILLCRDKDQQVVEYALSRSLSPTLVAAYKTQLPNKSILQKKLNTLFHFKKAKSKKVAPKITSKGRIKQISPRKK